MVDGIWTGQEAVFLGGASVPPGRHGPADQEVLSDGARYNPTTDTWAALPTGAIRGEESRPWLSGPARSCWSGAAASTRMCWPTGYGFRCRGQQPSGLGQPVADTRALPANR